MSLRYLIDTDWAIHYMNGDPEMVERLAEFQPDGIGMSLVSLAELWEGVHYSGDPAGSEQGLREFLRTVSLLPLDEEVCRHFGKERGRLPADWRYRTASRAHRLTNNRRHFEMIEGLQLVARQKLACAKNGAFRLGASPVRDTSWPLFYVLRRQLPQSLQAWISKRSGNLPQQKWGDDQNMMAVDDMSQYLVRGA
jgi:tRNA(fMet)-specific endonuclease VapC